MDQYPEIPEVEEPIDPMKSLEDKIEIIPIRDLEPDQLQQLGLNPLPGDFVERALRDPSPIPNIVPPPACSTPVPEVLQVLEDLGLPEVVHEVEEHRDELLKEATKKKEEETPPQPAPVQVEPTAVPNDVAVPIQTGEPRVPQTDAEFAQMILEREEVIEGTNAIGVNFMKYVPQTEFLKKSEVFQTLHESGQIKQLPDSKRWTTFLDKPKRPIPKAKPRKPSEKPTQHQAEEPSVPTPEPSSEAEAIPQQGLYEIPPEEEFEALVRLPTPEPIPEPVEQVAEEVIEVQPEETVNVAEDLQLQQQELQLQQQELEEQQLNQSLSTEEKSDIELQLEEIQRQLEAIQQLPFEIQQHLSMVQEQLTKIVQLKHEQETKQEEQQPAQESLPEEPVIEQVAEEAIIEQPVEEAEVIEEGKEEMKEEEFKLRAVETPPILPPEKKPKKEKPFTGLGPAPRPLILPGGRKWKTPKDAYNDEFIAETLSAQAEIITGSTLGVNFRRYEPKHVNLDFLKQSNVYKLVHDLEDSVGGMADRPEVVPALQDYIQAATPAAI